MDIGEKIVSDIGETLKKSGVFDNLVEKGKDPDYNAIYIYAHHHAWLKDVSFFDSCIDIKEGKRRVTKVRRGDRVGFEFEFVDEPDVVYTTNYGWSFILDTPDNVEAYSDYQESWKKIKKEQERLWKLLNSISLD